MTSSRRRITSLICSSRRDSSLLGDDTLGRLFWVIDSFEMPARGWPGSSTSTVKRRIAPLPTRPAILLLTVASERSSFFARSVLEIRASSRRTLIISWSALSNSPLLFQAHDRFQDAQDFANLRSVYDERR